MKQVPVCKNGGTGEAVARMVRSGASNARRDDEEPRPAVLLAVLDQPTVVGALQRRHRGMCLGLDIPDDVARAVDYVEERLPWQEPTQEFMLKLLWTKFAGWTYEDEVRIHDPRGGRE